MSGETVDDDPQIDGRCLSFLDCEHDRRVWVPIDRILFWEADDRNIDIHLTLDVNEVPHDQTFDWYRVECPDPHAIASLLARAATEGNKKP